MKVILTESTNNVGMVGEIVNVKPGFARNFLIPQKKAVVANENNMKVFKHQQRMMEKKIAKAKELAEVQKKQIDGKEVTIIRKTAKANKLFGSVTSLDIQKAITEQIEMEINRKGILLAEPIKKIGSFDIDLTLDGGVAAMIKVHVEPDPTDVQAAKELAEQAAQAKKEEKEQQAKEQLAAQDEQAQEPQADQE